MIVRPIDPPPMSELNTTPLIDVMLVLLIMFIITIPPQTDAVKLDLPNGAPLRAALNPVKNRLVVTERGTTLWNGTAVSRADLSRLLVASQQLSPLPELHLQPEERARYDRVDEVLALTKRAGVEKMGFVGNERYQAAF